MLRMHARLILSSKKGGNATSTSTLFNKNIDYNRLAHKIAIANLGGPVKRRIKRKEKKGNEI